MDMLMSGYGVFYLSLYSVLANFFATRGRLIMLGNDWTKRRARIQPDRAI
jgi:hypothetical protein